MRVRAGRRVLSVLGAMAIMAGAITSCGGRSATTTTSADAGRSTPTLPTQSSSSTTGPTSRTDIELIAGSSWPVNQSGVSALFHRLGPSLDGLARTSSEELYVEYGTNLGAHVEISALSMVPGYGAQINVVAVLGLGYGLKDISRPPKRAPVAYLLGTANYAEGVGKLNPSSYVYVAAWADKQGSWVLAVEATSPELRTAAIQALAG